MSATVKLYLIVGLGLAAAVIYAGKKASSVVSDLATTTLNPFSDQNLAYRGVNSLGASISGDKDFTLGSATYNALHPAEVFDNPTKPFCSNLFGIGCPSTASKSVPYDEDDDSFLLN